MYVNQYPNNVIHNTYLTSSTLSNTAYNTLYSLHPHFQLHHVSKTEVEA